jgi:hypothetical protein
MEDQGQPVCWTLANGRACVYLKHHPEVMLKVGETATDAEVRTRPDRAR